MGTSNSPISLDTLVVHAGRQADPVHGALRPPVYFSVAFEQPGVDEAMERFRGHRKGYTYGRTGNPSSLPIEVALAELDGAAETVGFANGQAAMNVIFNTLLRAGDEFLLSQHTFGGTHSFATGAAVNFGWHAKLVNPIDAASAEALVTDRTKFIMLETVSNPDGVVADLDGYAALARERGIPLILDNTLPTPYLLQAGKYADIVWYSGTKYLNGHGTGMSGFVSDMGRFDWSASGRYPVVAAARGQDSPFVQSAPDAPFAAALRFKATSHGGILTPHEAFLTLCGIDTLALRMTRQVDNATQIAQFLSRHPAVESVQYSGLPDSPQYIRSQRYLPCGVGALLSFNVRGGRDEAVAVAESTRLICYAANIGQTRSLIVHPFTTTHRQSEAQRLLAGVRQNPLRLSVGIESPHDLIADLEQALVRGAKSAPKP